MPSPVIIGDNIVFAEVMIDGQLGTMLVDTGAPYTLVDPAAFPGAGLPAMGKVQVDVTFGGVATDFTVDNVPAYSDSADQLPAAGIVGGDLLRQFSVAFDYRDDQILVGASAEPAGVEDPGATVGFGLQGGGLGLVSMSDTTALAVPATRIPVTVDIEGTSHPFILDTGASDVVTRAGVFNQLVTDGRPQLSTMIETVYGMMTGSLTRARTITVGGEAVTDATVLNIGDDLLDSLAEEVGHPVDGLLGGTFLRQFLVTIDYPRGMLHLQRYTSPPASSLDELRRVGIDLARPTGSPVYTVGLVYVGSDAEKQGVKVNDQLIAIDGMPIAALDPFTVEDMLEGAVGATHAIQFGVTAAPANTNATLAVRVDDLLPDPS